MNRARSTKRYALALHDAAQELQCLPEVEADLKKLGAWFAGSPDLRGFLSDYAVGRPRRAKALAGLFSGRLGELTWRFVRFLESRKRLGLLPGIGAVFAEVRRERTGTLQGDICTAFPGEVSFVGSVADRFKRIWGRPIEFSVSHDSTLTGGLRVRVEDVLYDMSVRGLLLRMRGENSF